MRTRHLLSLGALAGLVGCATPYHAADLARVRELTRAPLPSAVNVPLPQAPRTEEEVAPLLAQPLTAESAVQVAFLNNRALRGAMRDMGVARGELIQAGLLPNPEVEFDLRATMEPGAPLQQDYFIGFDLTHALLTPLRTAVAGAGMEAARYRAAAAVVQLAYDVRSAFYALQAARQRLEASTRALEAFAAGREAARALYEAGNVPELTLASQEAAYESARATTAELELAVLEQRERLHRLLGLHGEQTRWTVASGLPEAPEAAAPPEQLERRAVEASLELGEMRARLDGLSRRTALERTAGWVPEVQVDVHAERDGDTWEVGGGASLSLPLFDRRQGTVASVEAQFDALSERYEAAATGIRSAAREARNRLQMAQARARQYGGVIVPARRRVMQQVQLQFNAMQVGIFQLLQARREQLDAELAHASALQDYWTARAAVDALLGGQRVGLPLQTLSTPGTPAGEAGGH
ncbi:MAG TPA: TolC family protein [Archangium sp.]|uniref:TolC family protein n=1 Tax=Archangium sp. TaxID=1872627 RepID=UPI002E32010F|nr:TolC family protein [Archangium sp.]HEX5751020.1 TolC family protein [Archangium sp.]